MRDVGSALLEELGYDVLLAENGARALELYAEQNKRIDLVLMDMTMPKMNGRELCDWVVKNIPDRGFPIVVLTSRAETEHREWAGNIDNLHFMEKPVSMRALTAIVERLGNSGSGQSS